MDFGKVLSFLSPAYGAFTGQGIGKALPFLSPAYGLATGQGPWNGMAGNPMFGGLLSLLLGGHHPSQGQATDYRPIQASIPGQVPLGTMDPLGGASAGVMGAGYGTGGPLGPGFNPYLANV